MRAVVPLPSRHVRVAGQPTLHSGFGWASGITCAHRCNVPATYPHLREGKKYLPGVGGLPGKLGDRAFGHGGRASFTLYVLLGPSLAVALALAGFSLMQGTGGGQQPPGTSGTPTASPLVSPTNGAAPTSPAIGASAAPVATPGARTSGPTGAATAAPTAPPAPTNPPTLAATPSLPIPPTPTPPPTSTPVLPTLPPVPTLPRGLP